MPMSLKSSELSPAQLRALRRMMRDENQLSVQIAGYGAAPLLSASRALVRKGLAFCGRKTGYYGITDAGMLAYFEAGNRLKPSENLHE